MKTGKLLGAFLVLLACACVRKEQPEPQPALKVALSITRSGELDSKATVKTAWASGDVVYVFFKGVGFPKYLEMKYDGTDWVPTPKNSLSGADLSAAADQRMTAVFLPYGNALSVQADGTFSSAYSGFFLQAQLVGYTYDGTLHGTLDMVSPALAGGDKLIHLDVSGYTSGHLYNMYQESVKPLVCTGVSADGSVLWAAGNAGEAVPGYESGTVLSFSGILDASAVGVAADYQFSLDDTSSSVLYTRDAGTKTVSRSMAIGLGDLSSALTWNANAYVDLGLPSGTLWATRNLGGSNEYDYGLYYSYGETVGYPYGSSHAFVTPPTLHLDTQDFLLPDYDAAHVALKGLWRMPTVDDTDQLVQHTTQSFGTGGMTFTSKSSSAHIFLPAAGFISNQTRYSDSTYGAYWTSKYKGLDYAFFLGFGSTGPHSGDNTGTYCGQSVRPVFTRP